MADWTTIADATLEPGKPWRSVDALAVRDNPIAIAEGASGAPRVRTAALQAPASGTANLIFRLQDAEDSTSSTAYLDTAFNNRYSSGGHLGVMVLVAGVITCSAEHKASTTEGTSSSDLRIVKNGVLVQEWNQNSTSYIARQVDVTVAVGDLVVFQQKGVDVATSFWRNLRIYSANPDMAVC